MPILKITWCNLLSTVTESSEEIIDWVPSANDVKTIPRKMMNIVNASLFLNNTPKPHLPWYKNKNTIVALVLLIMFVLLLIALLVALLLYPYQYVDEKNHYNEGRSTLTKTKETYRARRENLNKFSNKNNNKSVQIFAPRRVLLCLCTYF